MHKYVQIFPKLLQNLRFILICNGNPTLAVFITSIYITLIDEYK